MNNSKLEYKHYFINDYFFIKNRWLRLLLRNIHNNSYN